MDMIQSEPHVLSAVCAIVLFFMLRSIAIDRGELRVDRILVGFLIVCLGTAWSISVVWTPLLGPHWCWAAGAAFMSIVAVALGMWAVPRPPYNQRHDGDIRPDSKGPPRDQDGDSGGGQGQGTGSRQEDG